MEINKYKKNKLIDNRKGQTINIKNKNNFLNENYIKNALKDKNQEKQNNLNININDRRGNNDQLDFFQKFIINKNKIESTEKSPSKKNIEINCNLILTKKKEKKKKKHKQKKKKFQNKNKKQKKRNFKRK